MKRFLWCVVAILSLGRFSFAQDDPNLEIGLKPYGSYQAGKIDVVNLDNGNVSLYQILRHIPQRGGKLDIDYLFRYNGKSYTVDSNCDPVAGCNPTWVLSNDLGSADSNAAGVEVTQNFVAARSGQAVLHGCDQASNTCSYDHISTLALADGGSHTMGNFPHAGFDNSPGGVDVFNGARSLDGTGLYAASDQTVTLSNGVRLYTPYMTSLSGVYLEDPNGNRILWTMTPGTLVQTFTDTLGRTLPGLPTSLSDPNTTNYWGLPTTSDFSNCTGSRQIQSARVMNFPAYGGGSTPTIIKLCFVQIALQTNFGPTLGAIEFSGTRWFLQSIVLPDLTAWAFEYDSRSPGDPSTVNYGDLTKVTLPTGGTISYSWQNWPPGPQAGYASVSRAVSTRTLNANDGTGDHTWTYEFSGITPPSSTTTTVTEPIVAPASTGAKTIHTFAGGYETQSQAFDSSGNLLKTIQTQYSALPNAMSGTAQVPVVVTTTLSNGLMNEVDKSYLGVNSTGTNSTFTYEFLGVNYSSPMASPTDAYIYDYGAGQHGSLLRHTHMDYEFQTNPNFLTLNLISSVHDQITYDGAGSQMAKTTYGYDESGLGSSGVSTQFNSSPINGTTRGNQTSVQRWLNTTNSSMTSTATYFNTGTLQSLTDPLLHATTHSYDTFYAGAYPTMTCSPQTGGIAHCVTGTYDFNTGVLTSLTNENGTQQASGNSPGDAAHTSNSAYDSMLRITSATAPPDPANGGLQAQTSFTFSAPNVFPLSVQRTKSITGGLSDSAKNFFDGLGRVYRSQHVLPGGTAEVDTQFDPDGHTSKVSNPYFSTSDPTYGITTNLYDALDRVTQTTKQDGSVTGITYDLAAPGVAGVCTISTDEGGHQRRACSDALGRLVEVDEPNQGAAATNATGSVTISGSEQSTTTSVSITVAGSGFEAPVLGSGANAYQYHPTGSTWTFGPNSGSDSNNNIVGGSGITGNNSGFTSSNPSAPEGAQVAFLQGGPANYISQSLSGFQAGVNYTVSFQAAQRGNFNTGGQDFDVYLDSTFLATFRPASTSYVLLSTPYFATTAGTHTLKFVGRDSAGGNGNAAFIDAVQVTGSVLIPNSGFEAPALGAGNFQYSPTGGSWTFGGGTGISANGSGFTSGNPGAPEGSQVAFIQFGSDDVFYQSLSGFQTGVSYTVSFSAAQRGNSSNGGQDFDVYLDSTLLSTFRPASTSYSTMSTAVFTTTAGTHALRFVGRDSAGGNNTAFIDAVQITGTVVGIADAGTVTISVNGTPYSTSFGYGDTYTTIASRLATTINAGSYASATASGGTVNLTSKTAGTIGDYSLTASYTWNSSQFTNSSFTTSTSGAALSGAYNAGDIGNNPFVTLYAYDALGNLLRVDQKGTAPSDSTQWRTRLFTYNSLSQLLTAINPESGTITYSYDADGNLLQKTSPAPNQTGSATQTVSFCYDALHRLLAKGYSAPPNAPQQCLTSPPWLPNPAAVYAYDSGTNAIGKLTSLTDQAGTASYTYDILGRLATETRTLTGANNASFSKNLSYEYNLDGSLYKLHYPSGNVVTYEPGAAGLALSAKDIGNNINYVTGTTYGPDSGLTGFISGYSTSFAGITNAFSYNNRLQPVNMSANAPGQTVFSIGYDFHIGNGTTGADNGNVYGITNYKDQTRNQTFTYDALNRLASARNAGTDCTATVLGGLKKFWGNNYTYNAWGNLVGKSLLQTPPPAACAGENLSVTADAHNWIHATGGSDYQYDAAGNMTFNATPPTQNYTYDQENRLTGAAGYAYTYDADGNRVVKSSGSTGTLYWYMTPGIVGESDLSGNLTDEYVFFDGERVARKSTNGIFYYFSDHLKTASVITDASGNIKSESDFYPWGGELQFVNNDSNHYKFTGKERDAETQLDYFGARYYSNGLGRWVSADWSPTPIPVPYANLVNPQTLNLYSYVLNLPTSATDLDGHFVLQQCATCEPPPTTPAPPAPAPPAPPAPAPQPPPPVVGGISISAILTGAAIVFIPAMIWPDALPGGTVGQSDADERSQIEQSKHEREEQNSGVDPQEPQTSTSGSGARQGGGDQQTAPGTKKDRSLDGTIDQLTDLERAQRNQEKTKKPINSTEKSNQNMKKKLRDIHQESDATEKHH